MLTFQVDSFEASIPELMELFPRHHAELGLFQDRMPLDPDLQEYVRRERAGELFLVTGRQDGSVVGYCTTSVRPGFHYKGTLTGTADIYYIVPEHRDRGLALPLFRTVEKELRRRRVQCWYSGTKAHNPLGAPALHRLLGFVPADLYFVRWLGEPG